MLWRPGAAGVLQERELILGSSFRGFISRTPLQAGEELSGRYTGSLETGRWLEGRPGSW